MEWQQDLKDPKEFLETVKVDLFTDEVFVFTPKGDVKSLPRGATPVDFAYAIHSDVGGRCVGAKVNGKIVPLRYKLKNGDMVEVLTSPQAHPSKDWLTFVKTSRAQQRIRGFIKQQQRDKSLQLGRELAEREFKRFGLNLNKLMKSGELEDGRRGAGLPHRGRSAGGHRLRQGRRRSQLHRSGWCRRRSWPTEEQARGRRARRPRERQTADAAGPVPGDGDGEEAGRAARAKSGVQIGGVDDVLVRFGRCCNPVPGRPDRRLHHPRPRRHRAHGRAARRRSPPTPSAASTWPGTCAATSSARSPCACSPRIGPGLLADISNTFSKKGVNISQANCRATGDDRAVNTFEVTISDLKQLTDLMRTIERLNGVYSVERVLTSSVRTPNTASAAATSSSPAETSPERRTPETRPPAANPPKSATPAAPPDEDVDDGDVELDDDESQTGRDQHPAQRTRRQAAAVTSEPGGELGCRAASSARMSAGRATNAIRAAAMRWRS